MSIDLEEGQLPPFKLLKSETLPLTKALASEMRAMKPSPTERELVAKRVDFLRDRLHAGLFHSPHWAVVVLNDEKMRANGQHSSEMLCSLNGEFPEGLSVHLDTFGCRDIDGAVALFRQFDDRRSARSAADVAQAYQGVEPALADVPRKLAKLGAEGIVWYQQYVEARHVDKGDDRYGMLHDQTVHPFLIWLGTMLAENRAPEVCYPPVIAALYATYGKDTGAATDFWGDVISGGKEFEEDHPTSVLQDWLRRRRVGDFKLKPITQLYQGCVYAWNAFRDERDTISGIKCDIRKKLTVVK